MTIERMSIGTVPGGLSTTMEDRTMRITAKRIEQMRYALRYLEAIAEDKSSAGGRQRRLEGEAIFAAVEGFEELLRRLERRTGQ